MNCGQCNSEFETVIAELEAGVRGDIIRIKNDLKNPCCPECMRDALNEMAEAVSENVFPW